MYKGSALDNICFTSKIWSESVFKSCVSGSYSTTLNFASGKDKTRVSRTEDGSVTFSSPAMVPFRVKEAWHSSLILGGRWSPSETTVAASDSSGTSLKTRRMFAPATIKFFWPWPKKLAYIECSTPVGGCGVRTIENIAKTLVTSWLFLT